MGLMDLASRVLTTYEADISDHKAKVRELTGEQQALAKAELEAAQARNDQFDSWLAGLAKVGIAIAGIGEALKLGMEGLRTYGEMQRLTMAAGAADVERLQDAFHGLVSEHDALKFAAQEQHGIFKLTQEQMETVAQATVALTHAGFDQAEVMQKLEEATIGLRTRGLKELGIEVQQGSTQAETLNNVMSALSATIERNKNLTDTSADSVQHLSVMWDNLKESVLGYVGATLSLDAAKNGHGLMFDAANVLSFGQAGRGLAERYQREAEQSMSMVQLPSQYELDHPEQRGGGDESSFDPNQFAIALTTGNRWIVEYEQMQAKLKKDAELAKKMGLSTMAPGEAQSLLRGAFGTDTISRSGARGLGADASVEDFGTQLGIDQAESKRQQDLTNKWFEQIDKYQKQEKSAMERVFGKPDELNVYAQLFGALTSSIGSAYDAIVTGAEPAGVAFKKMLGAAVEGAGKQMAVESVKEGAFALASLAMRDFDGAAKHGLAAAEFAGGAILAGVVANELGYGSSGSSAGASTTSAISASMNGGNSAVNPSDVMPTNWKYSANGEYAVGTSGGTAPDTTNVNTMKVNNLVVGGVGGDGGGGQSTWQKLAGAVTNPYNILGGYAIGGAEALGSAIFSKAPQSYGGGAGGVGGAAVTHIHVHGDSFAQDSPRMRQTQAERLVIQALGNAAVGSRG